MEPQTQKPKAIALISGGLDSLLSAKIVKDLGIEVTGLHLLSPFGCKEDVEKVCASIGIPLITKEKGEAYLDLVQNPRYGYGANMNPCIDCRIFMFQLADTVRQDLGADFIVTGEVLGQRPMSQQRHAINKIDNDSPLGDKVLRPLSAKLFAPSFPETQGWIKREDLFAISGRSRKPQLEMAAKYGLSDFSKPGGGCLLTEAEFSARLRDFFSHKTHATSEERLSQSQILRLGRHFRFSENAKAIVARNNVENLELKRLWPKTKGHFFSPVNFDGPVAVFFGEADENSKLQVGKLISRYGKSKTLDQMEIGIEEGQTSTKFTIQSRMTDEELERYRL